MANEVQDLFHSFDHIPESVIVVNKSDFKIIHVNSTCAKDLAPNEKMKTLGLVDDLIQPGDRDTVLDLLKKCAVKSDDPDAPTRHSGRNINTLMLGTDCQYPIYRSYDWVFSEGPSDTILCFGRIITEVDQQRKDVEKGFMDFFDNAPIAMHWLGGTGNVMWANKTEMHLLGYTAEEYIGKPIMDFCPDEEELVLKIFHQLGTGNTIADVPVRFRTKDNRIKHLLIDSNVNWNRDGSFNHTRCFIRDDTARQVREARLMMMKKKTEEFAQQKSALLRKIVHEVRTPCNDIIGSVGRFLDEPADTTSLKFVRSGANRLGNMMEDVADLVMFGGDMVPMVTERTFDLEMLLDAVMEAEQLSYARPGVEPKIQYTLNFYNVIGDERCLTRVLGHLLRNAFKASKAGEVLLRVETDPDAGEDNLLFTVQDQGGGVDVDMIEGRMRDPWRVQGKILDGKGLGCGLHVCHNILQVLEAELKVESVDDVSKFTFSLALAAAEEQPARVEISAYSDGMSVFNEAPRNISFHNNTTATLPYVPGYMTKSAAAHIIIDDKTPAIQVDEKLVGIACDIKKHVLIVEDNRIAQMVAEHALSKLGMTSNSAEHGVEALEFLKAHPLGYDLILMDLRMPVMDGLECTKHIRTQMKLDVPILAFTAEYSADIKRECMELGMNGFLSKPVNAALLSREIGRLLNVEFPDLPKVETQFVAEPETV
eukprot:CAMPEP_0196570912 /NCGR_PEP_ID=MMETSP1081-20130531/1064_1 /TAXON_ID=36882 /ORGANISM="Pyramimonas amylifera, Strain CCMP720" /LENGTH=707 /DNA_ID=CAMNT_0041887603 /DNA_START=201 /DNA_END=2324 /DNA_ORIENTATION=-